MKIRPACPISPHLPHLLYQRNFLEFIIAHEETFLPTKKAALHENETEGNTTTTCILLEGAYPVNWSTWSLDRIIIFFVGLAYLLVGVQVTLFHYRQNFHHKVMYSPVITSPLVFISAMLLTFNNAGWAVNLFLVFMFIGAISGLIGFYYHVRGVGLRVGGYETRNFLIGPPVVLPLMFTALAALGMIAVWW
jgi:hypothetical protein